jgi:GT2 family glycosyltransferase
MKKRIVPLISVIICAYNTKELTIDCLNRLYQSIKNLQGPVEVTVVENGTDGTGKLIRKKYPWVKLLEPKENTGFAKGNNLGIAAVNKASKYVLLLNTDALVNPDTLKQSVNFMHKYKNCDALGCRLRLSDGKVQASGGFLPTPFSVLTWIWGIDLIPGINKLLKPVHPKDPVFFNKDRKVGWVMGAYLFMKKKVLTKTKGLDENFFMYMEEVEWCKRMWDAGFNIYYTPSFEITHLDKASSKSDPEKFRKIFKTEIVGIVYFLKKYYPNHLWWIRPMIKLGLVARVLAFGLTGNNMRRWAYSEALKDV